MKRIRSASTHITDWWLMVAFATAAALILVSWLMPSASTPTRPIEQQAMGAPAPEQAELGPLAQAIVVADHDAGDGGSGEEMELAGASIAAYER